MSLDELLTRLALIDSCAVSDALDKLMLPSAVTGIQRLSTDRRVTGRVITVKLEQDAGRPASSRHLGTTAIETAQRGDVIVIEQRSGIDAAAWGGNLSFGAKLRGVSGVVIDGPARDVDEARGYNFPVFARSHTSRTARGRIVETGTNVPVLIGDVVVSPGDFVVADGSGVAFVTEDQIERVLEAAEAIAARERAMVTALREGTPISQVMGKSYEAMLKP